MTGRHWTPARMERVAELQLQGMTYVEMANALGVTRSTVSGLLYRHAGGQCIDRRKVQIIEPSRFAGDDPSIPKPDNHEAHLHAVLRAAPRGFSWAALRGAP